VLGVFLEAPAQARDAQVDAAIQRRHVAAFEQLLAGEDVVGMGQQHASSWASAVLRVSCWPPGLVRVLLPGSKRQPANSATRWAGSAGSVTWPG
jgi:hypothetical protein